jgi:hypothetical protein
MNIKEFRMKETWNDGYATGYTEGCKDHFRFERYQEAVEELIDGLFEDDFHQSTGLPLDRCKALLKIIRSED